MEFISEYYLLFDAWLRQSILMISMAQIATLLVILGNVINGLLSVFVKPYHFLVRVSAFVALCAFGYGAITAFSTQIYANLLVKLTPELLAPVIIGSFILIGIAAERGIKR